MNQQELQEKLQRYLSYLAQDNHNWNLLLNISDCYRQLHDGLLAQRYLDDAEKLSGKKFWAFQGKLYLESGHLLLAKEAYTAALAEQDTAYNRYHLAFCLYSNNEFEEALAILNTSDISQNNYEFKLFQAKIYHQLQQSEQAITILEGLHAESPADARVSGLLSLLCFDENNLEKAERLCLLTLENDAGNSEGLLVEVLLKTMQDKATVADIELLLANTPQESRLWFALGTTQMRLMNIPAAEDAFFKATQIWPDFYDGWMSLAWCYLLQNQLTLAENVYHQAIEIDDDYADAWGGLALVSALQDDMETAQKWLAKARLLDVNCFLVTLTEIIIGNQVNSEDAAKQLDKAFPEVATEINRILADAILMADVGEKVIH